MRTVFTKIISFDSDLRSFLFGFNTWQLVSIREFTSFGSLFQTLASVIALFCNGDGGLRSWWRSCTVQRRRWWLTFRLLLLLLGLALLLFFFGLALLLLLFWIDNVQGRIECDGIVQRAFCGPLPVHAESIGHWPFCVVNCILAFLAFLDIIGSKNLDQAQGS